MTHDTSAPLLDRVYADLGLNAGRLLPAAMSPAEVDDPALWRDVGEWLMLAQRIRADRLFFVGDDPVIVFSRLDPHAGDAELARIYRQAWSMARPRCLFVDLGDELRVYSLDAPPTRPDAQGHSIEPIDIVSRAADVQTSLARYHRDLFESGAALEDATLSPSGRADRRLLRDVAIATVALRDAGLPPRQAHGLIERAILVRYLEDRGVLTDDYFDEIQNAHLTTSSERTASSLTPITFGAPSRFVDFLADLTLTRALFAQLAKDFNGDLFVIDANETELVTQAHLSLLRDLLTGATGNAHEPLFLWAYDFSVVPTSLVSTMYELFYNQELEGSTSSTYYTPPELVEFVVADVLSADLLDRRPMICDPACGSGIFLVEAFRRIARHASASAGRRLTSTQLRRLLLERVAGCDIDEAAVRLAAFSLYIAFLNYQSPQDIRRAGPLPPLITSTDGTASDRPRPLTVADAFLPLRVDAAAAGADTLPWRAHSFDVVLGNPPWTEPTGGGTSTGDRWAKKRALPVGDRSPSQQFLWRALDLLTPDGVASQLVSAKVLFNTRSTSRAFRCSWLKQVQLQRVINFSEVRHDFFERAVAPFALLRFTHASDSEPPGTVVYETARTVPVGRRGSARFARLDRRRVDQLLLMGQDFLWKTYSAGDQRDHALVERLGLYRRLGDLPLERPKPQYGYQRASSSERAGHPTPPSWAKLSSLRTFTSWGPIRENWLEDVPDYVKFDPSPALFLERTLIVRRGVSPGFGPHARILDRPMAFRHHIYGIPLGHRAKWEAGVALGTLLSSVGRYWLYMVSGAWGTWKDEIRSEQLLQLPLNLAQDHPATEQMVRAAKALVSTDEGDAIKLDATPEGAPPLRTLLSEIDEAAFELFELSQGERDLVSDFWAARSIQATAPITAKPGRGEHDAFANYAAVFRSAWKPLLGDAAVLDAHFYRDAGARMIAAIFETRGPNEEVDTGTSHDASWAEVLERYAVAIDERTSRRLLEHGELRAVTDSAIVIVKRNEHQFWSASAARRDGEATSAQLLALQARLQ